MSNDEIGKLKFESFLKLHNVSRYGFTKEIYNRLDCYYWNNTIRVGVEIKNRKPEDYKYPDFIMEVGKYNAMTERIANGTMDSAQMVYFFGDTMLIFNYGTIKRLISNKIISEKLSYLPNSTDNFTHYTEKYAYYLPKEYAYHYKLINGVWKQTSKPKREL